MKKKSTIYLMALFLLISLIFGAGSAVYAQSDAEDVELAIVDTAEIVEADSDIKFAEIQSIADEMDYELAVDTQSIEWYLNDEIDRISNFAGEDISEEIDELAKNNDDLEELKDSSEVEDITDEVIDSIES